MYRYILYKKSAGPSKVLKVLTHCPCFFNLLLEGPPDTSVKIPNIVMFVITPPKYELFVLSNESFYICVLQPLRSI